MQRTAGEDSFPSSGNEEGIPVIRDVEDEEDNLEQLERLGKVGVKLRIQNGDGQLGRSQPDDPHQLTSEIVYMRSSILSNHCRRSSSLKSLSSIAR